VTAHRPRHVGRPTSVAAQAATALACLVLVAAVGVSLVAGAGAAIVAVVLLPLPGSARWFTEPGDPGASGMPVGLDQAVARAVDEAASAAQSAPVVVALALGVGVVAWTILAATDVAASGGERGWWWRSVAGTLTLAGLAWVLVAGPTSPSVAATAASAVAAMLVASCVPAGLRWRLRPSGRRQGPFSAGPSTSTAEQPASRPAG